MTKNEFNRKFEEIKNILNKKMAVRNKACEEMEAETKKAEGNFIDKKFIAEVERTEKEYRLAQKNCDEFYSFGIKQNYFKKPAIAK